MFTQILYLHSKKYPIIVTMQEPYIVILTYYVVLQLTNTQCI